MARKFIVVGDRFAKFAQLDGCISFSELQDKLEIVEFINDIEEGDRYYPGQGILAEQIRTFIESIEAKGISNYFTHWYSACAHFKAGKELTHKHKAANGLVTEPKRLDSNTFELEISVDGKNEILSDHVSGLHLQGMLLIEAARQSFLTVTEKYFLPKVISCHRYFIIQNITADFLSFVFPVDAKIIYKIADCDMANPLKLRFTSCIEIHQGDIVVSSIRVVFSVYQKHCLELKERSMAEQCLKHHLNGLSDRPQFLAAAIS